ncbi:hypothetical protein FRC08_015978 [Ceratobasidium sp. 394]|nr:hypothetical protein FRC08_015978 [Ceratobasidium sp. 394]
MTDQCKHITHFRHALALDECRVKFLPEHIIGEPDSEIGRTQKEVWFAGTHSDIGGGNKANKDLNLGAEPLKWMMEEAQMAGLSVKLHDVKIGIPNADITGSLNFAYEPKAKLRRADNAKLTWGEILIEQSSAPTADSIPPEESPKAIRKPAWEGGKYLIDAIDLVKDGRSLEPLNRDGSERWVEKLGDYITNDGKPELIWTYGGPSLLHKVAAIAQSQKARAIIRSVVGLKYDPESQVKKQKQEPGPSIRTSDNSGNSINGKWSHRG